MKHKKDDGLVQTAVRLPQSLRDRLSKVGGARGLGEEIRGRLEASFKSNEASADPKTQELLDAIASCAKEIANDLQPWSADPYAFAVLKETINMLLTPLEPKGEAAPNVNPESVLVFLFDDEPNARPEKLARYFVQKYKLEHESEEKRK
jgi:hypothetical protein